jgi:hypothetical protein
MNRRLISRLGVLVLALGLVCGGLDLAGAAPGANGPPAQTVTVGNTADAPVPVQQQGAAIVNVSNPSLPVTGTVKIDPTGNTVKTNQADNPAFSPAQGSAEVNVFGGNSGQASAYTVPVGKELVIQNVTFHASLAAGDDFYFAAVAQGASLVDYLPMLSETQLNAGQPPSVTDGGQTTLYFGPDQVVEFVARTTGTNGGIFDFAFNGYLVNVPA